MIRTGYKTGDGMISHLSKMCPCIHVFEHVCVHAVKIPEALHKIFSSRGVLEDVFYFLFRLIYFVGEKGRGSWREKHKQSLRGHLVPQP